MTRDTSHFTVQSYVKTASPHQPYHSIVLAKRRNEVKHRQSTLVGIGNGINVYSAVSNAHLHFTFIDSSSEAEKVIKFITGDGMMMMVAAVVARKRTDRQVIPMNFTSTSSAVVAVRCHS